MARASLGVVFSIFDLVLLFGFIAIFALINITVNFIMFVNAHTPQSRFTQALLVGVVAALAGHEMLAAGALIDSKGAETESPVKTTVDRKGVDVDSSEEPIDKDAATGDPLLGGTSVININRKDSDTGNSFKGADTGSLYMNSIHPYGSEISKLFKLSSNNTGDTIPILFKPGEPMQAQKSGQLDPPSRGSYAGPVDYNKPNTGNVFKEVSKPGDSIPVLFTPGDLTEAQKRGRMDALPYIVPSLSSKEKMSRQFGGILFDW